MIFFDAVHYCHRHASRDSSSRLRVDHWSVSQGQCVALLGASGSGKTTLLQLTGGILQAASGAIEVAGKRLSGLDERARRDFRLANVGFVFQSFELLPHLTVQENVLLPCRLSSDQASVKSALNRLDPLLENLGLDVNLRSRKPSFLSQGERQRVAIGRALIARPRVILADEPTGNLDHQLKASIVELLLKHCRENGTTLVMATHDLGCVHQFDVTSDAKEFLRWEDE